MEGRKVQRVGHSTITVSLPNEWVKKNDMRAGDQVFILPERDGTLKIMPSHMAQREEAGLEYIIDADACDEAGMLERLIVGCYMLGCDLIRITSCIRIEKIHTDEIRRIIRKLIGLGILEETPIEILLQCSLDPAKFKLDILMRRISSIASAILTEAMQTLLENRNILAQEAINREDEADMIYYLAVRLLLSAQRKPDVAGKLGVTDFLFIPAAHLMFQYLELIADYSEDIAGEILKLQVYRDKLTPGSIERIHHLGELAKTIFQKAVDCTFTRDLKIANGLLEMQKVLEIESDTFMGEAPQIPFLRLIVSKLNEIADKGATIAGISMDETLEEPSKEVERIIRTIRHVRAFSLPTKKRARTNRTCQG